MNIVYLGVEWIFRRTSRFLGGRVDFLVLLVLLTSSNFPPNPDPGKVRIFHFMKLPLRIITDRCYNVTMYINGMNDDLKLLEHQ